MPRPKGSKNKTKTVTVPTTDFAALIAEKAAAKESLTAEVATLEENLETIKADLKAKKAELKKLDTELAKLEEQKAEADAKAAEEAQRAELEDTIQKLMATGVSAAEIHGELAKQTCIGLDKIFNQMEKMYEAKMSKKEGEKNWYYMCHDMLEVKKLCDLKKYNEAIRLLSENIENDVYVDVSYFNRACVYSVLGKFDEAITDFNMCLKNKYRITETYDRLGKEYIRKKEFVKANEIYDLAIDADGNSSLPYHNRANVLIYLKKYEEALRDMNKAIKIDPSATNYKGRAVVWAYLEKYDDSLQDYGVAIELNPQDGYLLYGRSQIFFEVQKPEEAEKDAMKAIGLEKKILEQEETRRFFASLLIMYIEQNKQDKARELHSECKKIFLDENIFCDLL